MPRRGGLVGLLGAGVGMAAEYREHRKDQKQQRISRESSQQSEIVTAGRSSRPEPGAQGISSSSDLPPAYTDVANGTSDRSLAAGKPASSDKKAALAQHGDKEISSDDDLSSIAGDEEAWELDEAMDRKDSKGLPTYEESEQNVEPVEDLVREVITKNRTALAAAPGFERTPLPCPVILPQRRPRKKTRGFVRAYAPLLGECSGIDQETFLTFLENFYKSSQSSSIFPVIQIAAEIAGLAPSVIAMAVTTAVSIGARVGAEVQSRQRTNNFLDKMNEELFKPSGLYAMIVKYKSDEDVMKEGNTLLARFGIAGEKVDFNTNQSIAKYNRQLSDGTTGGRTMSDRMQGLRLASGTSKGTYSVPEAAALIFPDIDKAMAKDGPETFKDKAKDAKSFLGDYMDRRAQRQYARDDPNSTLQLPASQRAFKSKLADPNHPMYNGGLVGFVSGGVLSRDRGDMSKDHGSTSKRDSKDNRRDSKDQRRALKYEQRMDKGRDLSRKKQRRYDRMMADEEYSRVGRQMGGYGPAYGRGYGSDSGYGPQYDRGYGSGSGYDRYDDRSDDGYGYGGRTQGGRGGLDSGLIGAAVNSGGRSNDSYGDRSREYEDTYDNRLAPYGDPRAQRRSFDERGNAPAPYAAYGGQGPYGSLNPPAPYGGQSYGNSAYGYNSNYPARQPPRKSDKDGGGLIGTVRRVMQEDVLYLMVVNLPTEAELAEAAELLARAKGGH